MNLQPPTTTVEGTTVIPATPQPPQADTYEKEATIAYHTTNEPATTTSAQDQPIDKAIELPSY